MDALGKAIGSQQPTLRLDEKRFGPFKHLAPHRQCPKNRLRRIGLIKKELALNPKASGRMIEKSTGINRKMVCRLIKEEGLKESI